MAIASWQQHSDDSDSKLNDVRPVMCAKSRAKWPADSTISLSVRYHGFQVQAIHQFLRLTCEHPTEFGCTKAIAVAESSQWPIWRHVPPCASIIGRYAIRASFDVGLQITVPVQEPSQHMLSHSQIAVPHWFWGGELTQLPPSSAIHAGHRSSPPTLQTSPRNGRDLVAGLGSVVSSTKVASRYYTSHAFHQILSPADIHTVVPRC